MSWNTSSLNSLLNKVIDYRGKTPRKTKYGIRLITAKVIKNGQVLSDGSQEYIAERDYDEVMQRGLPQSYDILITTEAPLGELALWNSKEKIALAQRVILLRPNLKLIDPYFLFYYMRSEYFQGRLHSHATGTTVPGIKNPILKSMPIYYPKLPAQEKIGNILSTYDDLITTNQRRIGILEESARRIYREWFVHLRFPGHEEVEVREGVPEGWERLPFTKVADFVNGFAFKPDHQEEIGLPIIKIPELRDGVSGKTPRNSGTIVPQKNHVKNGDIIFSWSATLLVNEWVGGNALLNQHLFKVVPKNKIHKRLIRFAVSEAIPELLGHSVGATMQHIRRGTLDIQMIVVPDKETAVKFSEIIDPIMDMSLNLREQNRKLTQARDLLLPKLMSGKLDLSSISPESP